MRKLILLAALTTLIVTANADARVKIKGRGASMNFDQASIPAELQASFEMVSKKCIKCHTMERAVIAIQTGRAPITGQPFDRQAIKAYAIKMLRKPNSGMNKQEIRETVILLNYIMEENSK